MPTSHRNIHTKMNAPTTIPDSTLLIQTIPQLIHLQTTHQITAVQILQCYLRRAHTVHQATNCFTCFVPEALQEAAKCDQWLLQTGQVIGNLHGIPCTIKDHYAMKNLPITMGLKSLLHKTTTKPPKHDCVVVLALRKAGAVPFAKTNMTQQGDTWGGGNPAFGDTLNPWNTLRTSGGSSSGEGAIVGGSGSCFGIGSDVGGSVRIPASFCGTFGFKPTANRFSFAWDDGRTIVGHENGIQATGGILTNTVTNLIEILKACWSKNSPMFEIDVRIPPLLFNAAIIRNTKKLTIGYTMNGYAHPANPCPSMQRVLLQSVAVLQKMGHTLVKFDPNKEAVQWKEMHPVVLGLYGIGIENQRNYLSNSTTVPTTKDGSYGSTSISKLNDNQDREDIHPDLAANFNNTSVALKNSLLPVARSTTEVNAIIALRDRHRDVMNRTMREKEIDLMLCPAWSYPAPPVEEVRHLVHSIWTTQVFNYLDMPCGVVPMGVVEKEDLKIEWELLENDCDMTKKYRDSLLRSRVGSVGLPLSVQMVGLPWREEVVLKGMLELEMGMGEKNCVLDLESLVARRSKVMGGRPERVNVSKM